MKKIKKKAQFPVHTIDPKLEEVGAERAFEVEYDDDLNEAVLVNHYRRGWGDEFDADVEHGLNIEENSALIATLHKILEIQVKVQEAKNKIFIEQKSTPELVEGNPMQAPKKHGEGE